MQRASLQWESAKFCSFMKIRIVWLQISSSLFVAAQLYPTFLTILKKVNERAWVLMTNKTQNNICGLGTQKFDTFAKTNMTKTRVQKKLWEPLLSLKRIAADALLLRRWCCFASVGFGMSLQKKSKHQVGVGFVSMLITSSNLCYQ